MRDLRVIVAVAALGSGLVACGAPDPDTFPEGRVYERLNPLFTDPSECTLLPGAQPPCFQRLHFCVDGTVKMVLTDVPSYGRYTLAGAAVDVSIEYGIDQGGLTFGVLAPDALQAGELGAPFDRAPHATPACAP